MQRTIDTRVSAQGKEPGFGTVDVYELSDADKAARARKAAGICVAIGVCSLAIPLVHFVLPWLMLIIASVVYSKVKGQAAMLVGVHADCPACGEALSIPEQTLEWPVEWNCDACRKRTVIEPASGEGGGSPNDAIDREPTRADLTEATT